MGKLARVRANVNLPDLRCGEETNADPDDPLVAPLIEAGYLHIVRAAEPEPKKTRRKG